MSLHITKMTIYYVRKLHFNEWVTAQHGCNSTALWTETLMILF